MLRLMNGGNGGPAPDLDLELAAAEFTVADAAARLEDAHVRVARAWIYLPPDVAAQVEPPEKSLSAARRDARLAHQLRQQAIRRLTEMQKAQRRG